MKQIIILILCVLVGCRQRDKVRYIEHDALTNCTQKYMDAMHDRIRITLALEQAHNIMGIYIDGDTVSIIYKDARTIRYYVPQMSP